MKRSRKGSEKSMAMASEMGESQGKTLQMQGKVVKGTRKGGAKSTKGSERRGCEVIRKNPGIEKVGQRQ